MRRIHQGGFTLPELLVVIVVFIIFGAVAAALLQKKPQTVVRYNAQRQTDVALLMQSITHYRDKHDGALPQGITTSFQTIGSQSGELDLCAALVPDFLTDLPYDPASGALAFPNDPCNAKDQNYTTGYQIKKDKNNTAFTVRAPSAQGDQKISITKKF